MLGAKKLVSNVPSAEQTPMYRDYTKFALATLVIFLAAVILVNLIVDPYRIYPKISRFELEKSFSLFHHMRLHNAYAIEQVRPQHLIVGSSRSGVLSSQEMEAARGRAFNASMPGASLVEIKRAVEHAHATMPLESVIVGLDFNYMFQPTQIQIEAEDRWRKVNGNLSDKVRHSYQRFKDHWSSLLSVDSTINSSLALSDDGSSPFRFYEDGTWEIASTWSANRLYAVLAKQIFNDFRAHSDHFNTKELVKLLNFTDTNGVQVTLLISPMHGLLLQTIYLAGKWQQYLQWHRELVALVSGRNIAVAIYGLEDNALMVLGAIDAEDAAFVDGVHYQRKAGIEIVSCLVAPCISPLRPTRLDPQSIGLYLEQIDALRVRYVMENPAATAKLRKWLGFKPRSVK